jgi:mannose-6-phosphate isomerase-like protein (cupin superfamily)
MAGYTKLNLKDDVEDQAPKFDMSPELEFRTAGTPLEMENAAISYLRVAPNFRLPFGHQHNEQEEVYVLVGGSARLKLDDEVLELRPFDAIRIHRETMRNLEGGPDGAEVILFGAPSAGPGDVEMTQDWWSD